MAEAIASESLVSDLHKQLAEANGEAKKHRLRARKANDELDEARKQVDALTADRDNLQGRLAAAPDALQSEVDRLKGEIRTRDHRDAWAAVKGELHDRVTVEKLWAEIGYTPGDQVPTAEQITEQVAAAREVAPFLFKTAETANDASRGANGAQSNGGLPPGPGYGRGLPSTDAGFFTVRRSDLENPEWMQSNQGKLAAAGAESRVRFVD